MNLRRTLFSLGMLSAALLTGITLFVAAPVSAQVDTGLQEVGQTVKLSSTDPRVIASNIINWALGLIGIVLVVLILYAGFLYMTSGGDAEKVGKAKKIIINSIIGLIIILSAWGITRYVIDSLLKATQEGGGVSGTGGSGYVSGFGGGGGTSFRVKSITPQGDTPQKPRNTEVKIVFTKPVDEASAAAIAVIKDGGTTVGGTIQVSGALVTFTPTQACPAPNDNRKCFDGLSGFQIKIANTVKSATGQAVTCGGFAPVCTAHFTTGNLVDTAPPKIDLTYPTDGMPVKVNSLVDVLGSASDDSGVATVEFFDGATSIGIDGPNASNTPLAFDAKVSWDTMGAALGAHSLSATAADLDTNTSKSQTVSVVVRAEHCFNGKQDATETGIDCGGDANSPEYCGACVGGTCAKNSDCQSGFCQGGKCVEYPVIKTVEPLNGKAGTFVTLSGANFGYQPGTVTFLGNPKDPKDDKVAIAPQACVNLGSKVWSNSQAIVAVPDGAASGPIEIKNSTSNLADRTDQDPGPKIPDYLVDNSIHPGLCGIKPEADTVGKEADAIGQGFGNTQGKIWFGSDDYQLSASPWSDGKAHFKIPIVNTGPYPVKVLTAAGASNAVEFEVLEKDLGQAPQLMALDPTTGPQQEYLTLTGKYFGYNVGTVIFQGQGLEAVGDTTFPPACAAGFWRDDTVVIKVPAVFKNNQKTTDGTYQVKVKRADGKESNVLDFQLDTKLQPKPGICAIEPAIGPEGTPVQLYGDRFGFDKPIVTFSANKNAAVDSNTNQSVKTSVPKNAATGPAYILAQAQKSNAVNFQVRNCNEAPEICGPADKFQCCASGQCKKTSETCELVSTKAEFAWQMSTGLIPLAPYVIEQCAPDQTPMPTPSPSPWIGRAGGDQAPIDAEIKIRFSQKLEPSTVKTKSFHILRCTDKGADPCVKAENVDFAMSLTAENNQQDVVTLKPSAKLTASSTYSVLVDNDIKGLGQTGAFMLEMSSCGKGPNKEILGYCFRFKTKASTEPSQIGSVGVTPSIFYFHDINVPENYEAVPLDVNDKCIVLNCDLFNWAWSAGDGRGYVSNDKASNGYGKCEQKGWGNAETGDVPVDINAALAQSALKGLGKMFVNFLPPQVTAHGPDCNIACSNALVWADFSSKLDTQSVSENIIIRKCKNENCYESELDPPIKPTGIDLGPDGTELEVSHAVFEKGAFYFVLLRGGPNTVDPQTKANTGIKGLNGVPMTGANNPQGFTWKFRIKQGDDAFCKAERVDVLPASKFEASTDGRQLFLATPFGKADECDPNGQKLVVTGGTTWETKDDQVADFYKISQDFVKTDRSKLPLGCSSNCLAAGSGGLFGKVAVCGNKVIETTDSHFCKTPPGQNIGTTPKLDVCHLFAPGAKAGEECEPIIDGLGMCDPNTCLFLPVKLPPASTCGDGKVQPENGEACDFGPTCVGGSSATNTTPIAENSPCPNATAEAACENAGGVCNMHDYRGCSASCRHLGAPAGKTTCGNGDFLGDGKDCDDGNVTDGDGCSSACLHEGSKSSNELAAVCGNGTLEPGETCEATLVNNIPIFPNGCSPITCLHTGVMACTSGETKNCCGDGLLEIGKDCDDGAMNGLTGCSKICLFQGSSAYYSSANKTRDPSFCGNGILELGEQCEVGASSNVVADKIDYKTAYKQDPPVSSYTVLNQVWGKYGTVPDVIDRLQLAYVVGAKEPDPDTGLSSATLTAALMDQTGYAVYGLQCGHTSESDCTADSQNLARGLDNFGCCRRRPYLTKNFPTAPLPPGVCRNVQINLEFSDVMDTASVVNNFQVDLKTSDPKCPDGTKEFASGDTLKPGVWNWIKFQWHKLVAWFTGKPVVAEKFCSGSVTGQLVPMGNPNGTKTFAFNLDHALAANTTYRVRLTGDDDLTDNNDKNNKHGFKTKTGVVFDGPKKTWEFTTNDKICSINVITISDTTGLHQPPEIEGQEHPFLFNNPGNKPEERFFEAKPQAIVNNVAIPLSTTAEYEFAWEPWTSSNDKLVNYCGSFVLPEAQKACFVTQQPDKQTQLNGTAILTAGISITKDTINVPSSTDSSIWGTAPVVVLVCENPWPSLSDIPFRDDLDWTNNAWNNGKVSNLASIIFTQPDPFSKTVPFYNFSSMYCRDAGVEHKQADDLPALAINPVPRTMVDVANGILRQYLFTYGADRLDLKTDGIGVRIAENPMHLSPDEWYVSKGFFGNPKIITVDGYPALQDDNTTYIAAANQPSVAGPIYSNIYVISHNPDAQPETLAIFDQMVRYLTFNTNIQGQSNTCHEAKGSQYDSTNVYLNVKHLPVACTADYECVALDAGKKLFCDSNKAKMARDTQRMADFQSIIKKLGNSPGSYPQLTAGTYLKGLSNSIWTSWKDELGKGAGAWPVDPINRFVTCGRCEDGTPCMADAECAGQKADQTCQGGLLVNGSWVKNKDVDPATCWNSKDFQYTCPAFDANNSFSVSRLYQFQSFAGGTQYELASEFEVKPLTPQQTDWWYPKLPAIMYKCANNNRYCMDDQGNKQDYLCRTCSNPKKCKYCQSDTSLDCTADDGVCPKKDCIDVPPVSGICRPFGGSFKYADVCNGKTMAEKGICGDGVKNTGETCELGDTLSRLCPTDPVKPNVMDGHQQQACVACNGFAIDPKHPQCIADQKCGNGRIDKHCDNNAVQGCLTDGDCATNDKCIPAEACDDGKLNGVYGHCSTNCQGFGGYCGNGQMDAGETCDNGADIGTGNGTWSPQLNPLTCSFDCKGVGPYCGDQVMNGDEECDGQIQTSPAAICLGTSILCDTDADCPTNVECGSDIIVTFDGKRFEWLGALVLLGQKAAQEIFNQVTIQGVSAAPPPVEVQTKTPPTPPKIPQYTPPPVIPLPGQVNTTCDGPNPMSSVKYDDGKNHSVFSSCANLTYTGSDKVKRATQHVRTCKAPGSSKACTWDCWTECMPVGVCGDGILDGSEQCDDGAENGDTKPCLKTCKKNVCGDGFLNAKVEECDNGLQNGQATCNADYNSSCLSCTQSCKWVASAGGYCGDGQKNGPEQCDGTDGLIQNGSPTMCKQLGYDYGGTCFQGQNFGDPPTCTGKASCTNSCQYGGCMKCSSEVGTGVVSGRVWDALFQQVVPNARVSLMYKGVKVGEAFSDSDGTFGFNVLNQNSECDSYKIVIDMYQDNPCTGTDTKGNSCYANHHSPWPNGVEVDETETGGYFPYTSELFSKGTFSNVIGNTDGDMVHIDILPRPQRGMAYAVLTWKSAQAEALSPQMHIVQPAAGAFDSVGETGGGFKHDRATCDYNNRPTATGECHRDINYRDPGEWDLGDLPYGKLICLRHSDDLIAYYGGSWSSNGIAFCRVDGTENPACATDPTCHAEAPKCTPGWDDCSQVYHPPVGAYLNFAPFINETQPVRLYVTRASQYDEAAKQFKVIVAVTSVLNDSKTYTFTPPSGNGFMWYLGDVDSKKGDFTVKNQYIYSLKEQSNGLATVNTIGNGSKDAAENHTNELSKTNTWTSDPKVIDGIGCWTGLYQCALTGQMCIKTLSSNPLTSNTSWLDQTNGFCRGSAKCSSGFNCGGMDWKAYQMTNW